MLNMPQGERVIFAVFKRVFERPIMQSKVQLNITITKVLIKKNFHLNALSIFIRKLMQIPSKY